MRELMNDIFMLLMGVHLLGVLIMIPIIIWGIIPRYKTRVHTVVLIFASIATALLSWYSILDYINDRIKK